MTSKLGVQRWGLKPYQFYPVLIHGWNWPILSQGQIGSLRHLYGKKAKPCPADIQRWNNVDSMLIQGLDVESTLFQRFVPAGGFFWSYYSLWHKSWFMSSGEWTFINTNYPSGKHMRVLQNVWSLGSDYFQFQFEITRSVGNQFARNKRVSLAIQHTIECSEIF